MGTRGRNEDLSNLDVVERFESYEDYLDSQLTANDMGYLEDEEMARQLVELGYRGLGDNMKREVNFPFISEKVFGGSTFAFVSQDFEARKKLLVERTSQKHSVPKQLASVEKDLSAYPFLQVSFQLSLFFFKILDFYPLFLTISPSF